MPIGGLSDRVLAGYCEKLKGMKIKPTGKTVGERIASNINNDNYKDAWFPSTGDLSGGFEQKTLNVIVKAYRQANAEQKATLEQVKKHLKDNYSSFFKRKYFVESEIISHPAEEAKIYHTLSGYCQKLGGMVIKPNGKTVAQRTALNLKEAETVDFFSGLEPNLPTSLHYRQKALNAIIKADKKANYVQKLTIEGLKNHLKTYFPFFKDKKFEESEIIPHPYAEEAKKAIASLDPWWGFEK